MGRLLLLNYAKRRSISSTSTTSFNVKNLTKMTTHHRSFQSSSSCQRKPVTEANHDDTKNVDTLIIGGGPIGSSTAYHLSKLRGHADQDRTNKSSIVVLERDPSYRSCSAMLSAGGIRQQFSLRENVLMSLYGRDFLRDSSLLLSSSADSSSENKDTDNVKGDTTSVINNSSSSSKDTNEVDVQFVEGGYLFLANTESGVQQMMENYKVQLDAGCTTTKLLSQNQLKEHFPWMNVDDILLGSYGESGEGWFDPWSYIKALKVKNVEMGVSYVHAEPIGATRDPDTGRILSVDVKDYGMDGRVCTYHVDNVVNAAGAHAGSLADLLAAGGGDNGGNDDGQQPLLYPLPVKPRKRCIFFFHCQSDNNDATSTTQENDQEEQQPLIPDFAPLTVDTSMVYFRSEGSERGSGNFLCGVSPPAERDPDCFNTADLANADHTLFDDVIWPALYHRIPAFGNIKVQSSWAGLYEYNTVDQNAIIDFHPEMNNLLLLNGFSGHGLQHSPAAGRAGAELLVNDNKFMTLDLNAFRFDRFMDGGTPMYEKGII